MAALGQLKRTIMIVRKILNGAIIVVAILGAYSIWYMGMHSMGVASGYEVNKPHAEKHLLIVTQQSTHKDTLTAGIVAGLADLPVNIEVIDLTTAAFYHVKEEVDACILLHTWELFQPPGMVYTFQDSLPAEVPFFVVSTSGGGDEFLDPDIDGISSASETINIDWEIRTTVAWARLTLGFVSDTVIKEGAAAGAGEGQ
jgi:hypothetical protein